MESQTWNSDARLPNGSSARHSLWGCEQLVVNPVMRKGFIQPCMHIPIMYSCLQMSSCLSIAQVSMVFDNVPNATKLKQTRMQTSDLKWISLLFLPRTCWILEASWGRFLKPRNRHKSASRRCRRAARAAAPARIAFCPRTARSACTSALRTWWRWSCEWFRLVVFVHVFLRFSSNYWEFK